MTTEILTGALVLITAYYAWQNFRMVQEMRAARAAAIQPRLVPTVAHLPAGHANLRVINVGPGAALDVDIHLNLDPNSPDIHYTTSVIPTGEFHDFMIPSDGGVETVITQLDTIVAKWEAFRLTGIAMSRVPDNPLTSASTHASTGREGRLPSTFGTTSRFQKSQSDSRTLSSY